MLHDGVRIKEGREKANVSQADAARLANVPRSRLSLAESGSALLSGEEVLALERAVIFLSQSRAYRAVELFGQPHGEAVQCA